MFNRAWPQWPMWDRERWGAGRGGHVPVFHAFTADNDGKMVFIKTGVGDGTVSRATERMAQNWEGFYYSVNAFEVAWHGGRNVENLLRYSENLENPVWEDSGTVAIDGAEISFGTEGAQVYQRSFVDGFSSNGTQVAEYVDLESEYKRFSYSFNHDDRYYIASFDAKAGTATQFRFLLSTNTSAGIYIFFRESGGYDNDTIFITRVQVQDVTARTEKTIPDEYHATDTIADGDPDGRAVYGCENPNTVTDNVVTLGPRVPFAEMPWASGAPAATNAQIRSNDLADAEYTATNVTVGDQDETGIDGLPNTACTLTATAANGTVFANAITAASNTHTTKWYLKRETGAGTIELTLDNGSTWQDITSQLDTSFGGIAVDQAALANPQIGIRIVTDTDAVIVANAECHTTKTIAKVRGIPPIFTEGSAVAVEADELYADNLNHGNNEEVCYIFHLKLSYDYDEKSDGQAILSLNGGHSIAFDRPTAGTFSSNQGASLSEVTGINYSAGDILKIGIRASISSNEMSITVDGADGTVVTYDGYAITTALQMMFSLYEMKMRDLRRFNITGAASQKSKIDALMAE